MCLDGIHFSFANIHCIKSWMKMCALFITHWGLKFKNKDSLIVQKITEMYSVIKLHYAGLDSQSRSTILTIITNVLKNQKKYFESNTLELLRFLEEIGPLMDYEYTVLEDELWVKVTEGGLVTKELMIPWMLCIHISNALLKLKTVSQCSWWFSYRNYVQRMVKCTCDLINKPKTFSLAKIALYSLQLYVESPLAFDFLNINMTNFYDSIEPPLTALFMGHGNKMQANELQEAWLTCTVLMKFNQAFIRKFQHTALPMCYTFIKLHEQILQQILIIPECTVDLKALDLLSNTLVFFDTILTHWQLEWYRKSNLTYSFILNNVKKIVNSCLYIILRPKNIVLYWLDEYNRLNQIEKIPVPLMVIIMNRLITITGLCFSILYRTNPNLIDLMGTVVKDTTTVLIQNDFSVPKFELPVPYELTYGKLLCLAHFMCKALDALSQLTPSTAEAVPAEDYGNCIGLVEHQEAGHNFSTQKLDAYLRYAMYEYSGLADPWIHTLDRQRVRKSLEHLMAFLGQQVYVYIRTAEADGYFKRNLASELQFFYEHIKKRLSMSFTDQITASMKTMSSYKADMDIIRRYMVFCRANNKYYDAADYNFSVVIVHWFTKICQVY
ncbi:hypothetical protein NQ315_010239 [Exocentrus adspersus]|uniref:Uncharacterized protein n=1 Tax=Exocentrus adspersus TaxID=1586481 RepID=A0AAV8WAV8_9CUCU|nr:hypothetical protein NQ315_010239 [Exocentrus adspersus]